MAILTENPPCGACAPRDGFVYSLKESFRTPFLFTERAGFEPANGCPLLVFKTSALSLYATSPLISVSLTA